MQCSILSLVHRQAAARLLLGAQLVLSGGNDLVATINSHHVIYRGAEYTAASCRYEGTTSEHRSKNRTRFHLVTNHKYPRS